MTFQEEEKKVENSTVSATPKEVLIVIPANQCCGVTKIDSVDLSSCLPRIMYSPESVSIGLYNHITPIINHGFVYAAIPERGVLPKDQFIIVHLYEAKSTPQNMMN